MPTTIYCRLQSALGESEARQESINRHTGRPEGSDLETAHAVVKLVDLRRVMALVGEVLGMAEDEQLPSGEPADAETLSWALEWKKILTPSTQAWDGQEVADGAGR